MHFDTPIYKTLEQLRDELFRALAQMPRGVKTVLGKHLLDEVITMALLIRSAAIARGEAKVPLYNAFLDELEAVQFTLRGAVETACIPRSHYARTLPLTESLGKQAIGLRNSFAPAV